MVGRSICLLAAATARPQILCCFVYSWTDCNKITDIWFWMKMSEGCVNWRIGEGCFVTRQKFKKTELFICYHVGNVCGVIYISFLGIKVNTCFIVVTCDFTFAQATCSTVLLIPQIWPHVKGILRLSVAMKPCFKKKIIQQKHISSASCAKEH